MDLTNQNSWWNTGGLWQDADLSRVKNSKLNYHPRPFSVEDCQHPGMLTLRGPRRAGKTVSLKLLLADLIEKHNWPSKSICWTTVDTLRTLSQLEEHLLELVERYKPKLLLIDEATSIAGWQRVLKKLIDIGPLAQTCVIVTGSSSHDLKAGAERMAGRRGPVVHPDRVLLPMSYRDFCTQVGVHASIENFLRVGGFPFRVEHFLRAPQKETWDELATMQVFDDIFFYEIIRRRLNESVAIEIVGRLAQTLCTSVSYEGFAKQLSIAKDTARKYLDALGEAFLLATISSFDTARGRVAPKKDRKFIWIDPSVGLLASWFQQAEPAPLPARAEWVVGAELLRREEVRLWEGLSAPRNIFTWKNSSGNELDFLWVNKSRNIVFPVEVKYQSSISDWDFQVMERSFRAGMIVTAGKTMQRPLVIAKPLHEFLLQNINL